MSDIVTITPNPAVDVSTTVEKIVPVAKLRGTSQRRDPGGGGINVARVITRLGGDVTALYPVGGPTGLLLKQLIESEGVTSRTWTTAEDTREDFFVQERASGQPYRFILPGPTLSESEWQAGLSLLSGLEPFPRFVVGSGSLPRGVPADYYARMAAICRARGAQFILDTSGPALAAAVAGGVDLIKPSLHEMRDLVGGELTDATAWETAARTMAASGKVGMVALTMGHLGALLVTSKRVLRAQPLTMVPINAVGAGDSFLGALVAKLAANEPLEEAFRFAVAAGAAALLRTGTALCDPADITRLLADVQLQTA
ncbi:putative carbohydrate kinase pfkB family; 6-phosphofructokinase [Bradyrhizobium sp. ORS 375]|uniref:1-phosphofructokinase family hexose kinase n=1 Tax=Bradyrhizobium sp. (strain ORS 375) TaxID=566679 RepID=UPI0002405780|nr:1-phosphofructokinase family hexose kinase [Bradyrhizobium sp. ORS 375]CCD90618.1 putative carbohydrate kinase pfkB family; 6-phosphofructokinase [Bradyrhizobium sp. ORS 375]